MAFGFGFGLGGPQASLSAIRGPSLSLVFAGASALDPRITFTRNSNATYFNSSGTLTVASANTPRFDYDPVTLAARGLLIEEQRTNVLTYSEQFDNASWTKSNVTVTPNAAVAPDGTTTADLIYPTTTGTLRQLYNASQSLTGTHTMSFCCKAAGFSTVAILFTAGVSSITTGSFFNLANGTVGTNGSGAGSVYNETITALGNGWYRCTITIDSTASSRRACLTVCDGDNNFTATANGTSGIYLWGAQLEAGAFATSYIPTTTAQATRIADSATMTGTNFSSWYNATEGTLFWEFIARLGVDQTAGFQNAGNTTAFRLRKTSTNVSGAIARTPTNYDAYVTPSPALVEGAAVKTAITYVTNSVTTSTNGSAIASSSGYTPIDAAVLTMGGSTSTNVHIKRIAYYPRRLSNAELQGITT